MRAPPPCEEGLGREQRREEEPTHAVLHYRTGSMPDLEAKVRSGKVVIGRLRVFSSYTAGLAFVSSPAFPCDVVVSGVENRMQALHGDIVAVELLPEEQWASATNDSEAYPDGDGDTDDADDDLRVPMPRTLPDGRAITQWVKDTTREDVSRPEVKLAMTMSAPGVHEWGGKKPFGVVLAVLERRRSLFVVARLQDGALGPNEMVQSNRYYQFKSYDPLLPHIAVYGRDVPAPMLTTLGNYFFLLRLVTRGGGDFLWTAHRFPNGKILRPLGEVDSMRMNSFALCSANEISMADFSDEAYACVPEVCTVPEKAELKRMGRRDLREEEFVCSIDPATARDLDDALSITRTPGGYRVGVHIADVSYFVPPGSPLDEEARDRSTSVYLVEQVIPMLPRKLSEDYCSLNPGSDKFAFSCIFHLDHHGKVTSEWFGQSVIRNRCRLTYEEAQRILDGDEAVFETLDYGGEGQAKQLKPLVALSVRTLFELATKLRAASMQRGRMTIGNMRLFFDFEDIAKPTFPVGFGISRQIEANWLVEEFMLLANGRVASKIIEYLPDQALLRRHEPPDRKKIAALRDSLARIGLDLHGSASKSLQLLLDNAKVSEHYDDICVMLKYALQSAKYFANGGEEAKAYRGHYALAMPWYTHFTSPIRRYCDIIAHRQLLCALEIESIVKKGRGGQVAPSSINVDQLATRQFFYSVIEVENIVEVANVKKLRARQVSDASLGLYFCHYLKGLRRVWEEDANSHGPFIPRVDAVVVRVVEKTSCFTVFVRKVAQTVEISLKSKEQLFKQVGEVKGKNGDEEAAKKKADQGEKREQQQKRKKNEEDVKKDGKLRVQWGQHPKSGEEVEEELVPMTVLTGVLTIKKQKGYEELNMIVDPPWMRGGERMEIATTLQRE
ncbi:ribonuclease II-like protein [Trypanosoma grayi]|uniref:ribonuclease II-like protein n=1 Tax=Trypanosoma grayi TaxID=71804 RepID=UPI0004F466BF|nr:ribonuclease II-like protein [Trypanosoma grayi]KEG14479.1 ribonuclease II-like protein [Trypanosoma grayi]